MLDYELGLFNHVVDFQTFPVTFLPLAPFPDITKQWPQCDNMGGSNCTVLLHPLHPTLTYISKLITRMTQSGR